MKLALLAIAAASLAACGSSSASKPPVKPTSTTMPCVAQSATTTDGTAQVTVAPGTCLKGKQTVTVTGTGLASNSPGGIAECNSAAGQPTVAVAGNQVPVSCTDPMAQTVETSGSSLEAVFTVITGITGPPASGTDSAGRPSMRDATGYPCPPTRAQTRAGATCNINLGDASGNQLSVPVSFVPGVRSTSRKAGSTLGSSSSSQLGGLSG